ncbi:ABC transporter permease [Smaragdicoccus niigatensis]|uniref:ABC transporter permease n=1 Tax=Smaragdicoccus niigatensis TaxID=359359 RepID=UPI0003681BCE|nr:ABC transporter permease [Smaragdicoccus niigatensis]
MTRAVSNWKLSASVPVVSRWVIAISLAFIIFGILLMTQGVNPFTGYAEMFASTFERPRSLQQIAIEMAPLILGALAVAIPARAGLTNVGGEGQIIIGGVAAAGVFQVLGDTAPPAVLLVSMLLASMVAGAAWAGIAAAMRLWGGVNEAITTLLLNFVALDVLLFLIYSPWRWSPTGQPATKELADPAKLPVISGTKIHVGIIVALIAVAVVWFVLERTRWGFKISVAGGNAEAARRAGMRVGMLVLSALVIGGALAGLAGMVHYAGVEYKLRPGFGAQLGYISFLACWVARHRPLPIVAATFVFAALSVASDSMQLDLRVPAASTNILTALILIAVLGWTSTRKQVAA